MFWMTLQSLCKSFDFLMNFEVKWLAKSRKEITVTADRLINYFMVVKVSSYFLRCGESSILYQKICQANTNTAQKYAKLCFFIQMKHTLTMNIFNGSFTPMQFKIKSIDNLQTYRTYMQRTRYSNIYRKQVKHCYVYLSLNVHRCLNLFILFICSSLPLSFSLLSRSKLKT